ncbi:MAG: glycine reductase [Psychrilyobacter sp.]|nr:glycine reductase [Psychrilyobacter sp.]
MSLDIKRMIGESFLEIANAMETGTFGKKICVGITTIGSEHGIENIVKGAEKAALSGDFDVVLIGPKVETTLRVVEANTEAEAHKKMEELIDAKEISSAVTMHYSFPIGTSTIGRVVTPAFGNDMLIGTTTGTSATNRTEAMFKNALYGIATAKAIGISNPTLGILNVDSSRAVERSLRKLADKGYSINFGESKRSDGGTIMRGNDLLMGSSDVMVTDSLTGNILMKMFSSYSTGGSYEASGYGYGPGVSFDMKRTILILSRASGVPVVEGAIKYAALLGKNDLASIVAKEFEEIKKAGYEDIIASFVEAPKKQVEEFVKPEKQVVTAQISGIDIMDLDDAAMELMRSGIYAEAGMGCTGPIILVNDVNKEKAIVILGEKEYIAVEKTSC